MPRFIDQLRGVSGIYIHDGRFHFDEILACALLRIAGCRAPVIRTRRLPDDEHALYVDVGGKYDGERCFDHHQENAPERTEYYAREKDIPRTPHCAAGQLWARLGPELAGQYLPALPAEQKRFFSAIDQKLVMPADYADNGVERAPGGEELTLSEIVTAGNSADLNDPQKQNEAFFRTLDPVITLVKAYMNAVAVELRGEKCVRECFENAYRIGQDYVQLTAEAKAPWRKILVEDTDLWHKSARFKAVISAPNAQGTWSISMLPQSRTERFTNRYSLNPQLKERFPEFLFIHPNGFMGVLTSLANLRAILGQLTPAPSRALR